MTAVRHAIVDDLCRHLQASTAWFKINLDRLSNASAGSFHELTPEEVERIITLEETNTAPALATLARVGHHPDYETGYPDDTLPPPNPAVRVPSPSLVDELCDQLEENLFWPLGDAYYLRTWPCPRENWDLHDANKEGLISKG